MTSVITAVRPVIAPILNNGLHKGQCGRITVFGGSKEYSGAPYFAAMSALRCGSDYVIVAAHPEAAPSIKTFSPDLVVYPNFCKDEMESMIQCSSRSHSVVIGPGIGRTAEALSLSAEVINHVCQNTNLYCIIDADAVCAVREHHKRICLNRSTILTPNIVEYNYLVHGVLGEDAKTVTCELNTQDIEQMKRLSRRLSNACILRKQEFDLICQGDEIVQSTDIGSPRRCAGQGDLLAGAAATFAAWLTNDENADLGSLNAAWCASTLIRRAACLTYHVKRRSMISSDILNNIDKALSEFISEAV